MNCDNDRCRALGCVCESREVEALIQAARAAAAHWQGTDAPAGERLRAALAPFEEND